MLNKACAYHFTLQQIQKETTIPPNLNFHNSLAHTPHTRPAITTYTMLVLFRDHRLKVDIQLYKLMNSAVILC